MMAHEPWHEPTSALEAGRARDRAAEEAAAARAKAAEELTAQRLGFARDDPKFMRELAAQGPMWQETKLNRISQEDARRRGSAMYQPEVLRSAKQIGEAIEARRDPSYAGSPEARRALLGLAKTRLPGALNPAGESAQRRDRGYLNPAAAAAQAYTPGTAAPDGSDGTDGPRGPGGPGVPRSPRMTVQDLLKGNLNRLLGSQMEGFDEARGLAEQLSDLREQGIAGQEQLAEDTAAGREGFLSELDISRAEQAEVERVQRDTQKGFELARQQTQLDDALRASGVDKSAAGERLQAMGIDPGNFADAAQSETTAMLYSQNMSSADVVNQMDMVAEASAQFATNANDQASSAAMFGIGEDLTFAMQAVDQARTQGQIDDAQALQAISDAERNAMQAYDSAITQLDVQTLQAAQAAAARAAAAAEKSASNNEKLAAAALAAQAIEKYRGGGALTGQDYQNIAIADMSGALQDVGSDLYGTAESAQAAEQGYFYDVGLGDEQLQNAMELYLEQAGIDFQYSGSGEPTFTNEWGQEVPISDIPGILSAAPELYPQVVGGLTPAAIGE